MYGGAKCVTCSRPDDLEYFHCLFVFVLANNKVIKKGLKKYTTDKSCDTSIGNVPRENSAIR